VVQSYVYGENGQLLAMKKGSATYFYHYNAHDDVIALTNAQGNIAARYQYDTWGKILSQSGSLADEKPYRYAGYQYDRETGLYYLIARYYHPTHGVFLSLDPDPGDSDDILTQNGYTYANNNPVMLVDPDGHWVWLAINAGFAVYDGYKAYKSGKGWKGVATAATFGFIGGGRIKAVKKITHSAYTLTKNGKVVYVGRTKNIANRRSAHKRKHGDTTFNVVKKNLSYAEARGLEHRLYLRYGGKKKLRNKIRPISRQNKNYKYYIRASRKVYR
jgi:RHS repeat-associated protein